MNELKHSYNCKKQGSLWVTNVIKNGTCICRGFGKTQLKSFKVARVRLKLALTATLILTIQHPIGFASGVVDFAVSPMEKVYIDALEACLSYERYSPKECQDAAEYAEENFFYLIQEAE
jgi:hypothetical protein